MKVTFNEHGWEDYTSWLRDDRRMLTRINRLISAIAGNDDLGKPELLKHDLSGFSSRRIDQEHRLIYRVDDDTILIVGCRYHYR